MKFCQQQTATNMKNVTFLIVHGAALCVHLFLVLLFWFADFFSLLSFIWRFQVQKNGIEFTLRDSTFHSHSLKLNWFHRRRHHPNHQRHFNSRDCLIFTSRSIFERREKDEKKKSILVNVYAIMRNSSEFFFSFTRCYSSVSRDFHFTFRRKWRKKPFLPPTRYLYAICIYIVCEYGCSRWDADFLSKCTNALYFHSRHLLNAYLLFIPDMDVVCAHILTPQFLILCLARRVLFWLFLAGENATPMLFSYRSVPNNHKNSGNGCCRCLTSYQQYRSNIRWFLTSLNINMANAFFVALRLSLAHSLALARLYNCQHENEIRIKYYDQQQADRLYSRRPVSCASNNMSQSPSRTMNTNRQRKINSTSNTQNSAPIFFLGKFAQQLIMQQREILFRL